MNTSLKVLSLLIAAGYPVTALAEFAGFTVPSYFSAEHVLGFFVASLVTLTMFGDYSRRLRDLSAPRAPVIVPPSNAFATRCPAKDACLAA